MITQGRSTWGRAIDALRDHLHRANRAVCRLFDPNRFIFRIAKRNDHRRQHDPRASAEWKTTAGKRWLVILTPSGQYRSEIAILSLALPALVAFWFYLNAGVARPEAMAALVLCAAAPWLAWTLIVRLFHRTEVLGRIWDSLPPRNRLWLQAILDLPDHRLPYRWASGTPEEQLLRYALHDYFAAYRDNSRHSDNPAIATRLLVWFAAPVYLSLGGLFLQAAALSFFDPLPGTNPSPTALFALALTLWLVQGLVYYRLQTRRILSQVAVNPAGDGAYIPGIYQGARGVPPDALHSRVVRLGVPAALSIIATISFPVITSLLTPH